MHDYLKGFRAHCSVWKNSKYINFSNINFSLCSTAASLNCSVFILFYCSTVIYITLFLFQKMLSKLEMSSTTSKIPPMKCRKLNSFPISFWRKHVFQDQIRQLTIALVAYLNLMPFADGKIATGKWKPPPYFIQILK